MVARRLAWAIALMAAAFGLLAFDRYSRIDDPLLIVKGLVGSERNRYFYILSSPSSKDYFCSFSAPLGKLSEQQCVNFLGRRAKDYHYIGEGSPMVWSVESAIQLSPVQVLRVRLMHPGKDPFESARLSDMMLP